MLRVDPKWKIPCQCGPVLGWVEGRRDWCLHLEWKHRLVESVHGYIERSHYDHDFQNDPFNIQVTRLARQISQYNDVFETYLPPYNIHFFTEEGRRLKMFCWSHKEWLVRWYEQSYWA